jgi:hypothetical protein
MKLVYLTPARLEYERKLARIALHPFTTHSIADFIEDIERLETEIHLHPGASESGKRSGRLLPIRPQQDFLLFFDLPDS